MGLKRKLLLPLHIGAGVGSLALPLALWGWEIKCESHAPLPLYLVTNGLCLANAALGLILVRRRVPAYDIPSIRGFAVSCGVVASFVGMSLMLHESFGPKPMFAPLLRALAWISVYTVVYAWSDALGHMRQYFQGQYRPAEEARERRWFLPFKRASYGYILFDCVFTKPNVEELTASAAPSHLLTVVPVFFIAAFVNTALINVRYLLTGPEGLACLLEQHPDVARWASYNALLVVMVCSFSTFLGSMVLHRRIGVGPAALVSVFVYFLPLLNVALLLSRYDDKYGAMQDLLSLIYRPCTSPGGMMVA